MNRRTAKFISACAILSAKYHKPLYEIVDAESKPSNVYAELETDGWTWDTVQQRWTMPMGSTTFEPAPSPVPTPPPAPALQTAHLRIMADNERDCADALYYVSEALHACGIRVFRVGDLKPNYSGQGYRVYLDVGV